MNSCILLAVLVAVAVASVVAMPSRQTLLRQHPWVRIVGGESIDITEAPFQVSVHWDKLLCGGSIISSRFILTAGHCVGLFVEEPELLSVRVGSSKHASEGQLIQVKKIHMHEMYDDKTLDYDFSVVELAEEIVFDKTKQPIALSKGDLEDGFMLHVSGWGHTHNSEESNEVLRRVSVPTVNHEVCNKEIGPITDRMMCTGLEEGGKGPCYRDNGGPLYVNGTLYGVVSGINVCAEPGHPGVYGKVSAVVDWIRKIIN